MSDTQQPATRARINSVARAMNILTAIARSETGLSVREIAETIGVERQTAYHLVHTLADMGFIARGERRNYRLGLKTGVLAEAFQRQFSAPDHLRPLVRSLAATTGETCYAVGWWQGEIVTLDVARGTNAVRAAEVPHGQYEHAHARAAGKVLLAFAPGLRAREYLAGKPLVALTPSTLTDLGALQSEFETIRKNGYAIDNEEFALGVCCMAVPLEAGTAPFAIALSAPAERFRERKHEYLQALNALVAQ